MTFIMFLFNTILYFCGMIDLEEIEIDANAFSHTIIHFISQGYLIKKCDEIVLGSSCIYFLINQPYFNN
jgi:hypothetical protein